jgi:hypothetical protein
LLLTGAVRFDSRNLLTTKYAVYGKLSLSPMASNALSGHGHQFMMVVGVVEVIAGIGVALRPKVFAYIVAI